MDRSGEAEHEVVARVRLKRGSAGASPYQTPQAAVREF
jgi:hypothetical protein